MFRVATLTTQYKRKKHERAQCMAAKMFRTGENDIQGGGEGAAFAEFGGGQIEEKLSAIFNWLMGSCREDRDIIPKLHSERMKGNGCLLQQGNSDLT